MMQKYNQHMASVNGKIMESIVKIRESAIK